METLILKYKGRALSKKIIGSFWILYGITALFFLSISPLILSDGLRAIPPILLGIMFFTPLVGNNETRFEAGDTYLKIKWETRIRDIIISDNEIEKIILRNRKIEILRKGKKAIVLPFENWKLERKTKVYEFMIGYAKEKNIVLER